MRVSSWGCVWLIAFCLGACVQSNTVQCGTQWCGPGYVCTSRGCASTADIDACANQAPLATCTSGTGGAGYCVEGACVVSECGNGALEPEERCDDGNQRDRDGCSGDCRSDETCGNGMIDLSMGEECEDGGPRGRSSDGCSSSCQSEFANWTDATPVPQGLGLLFGGAAAYDQHRKRVVHFGGIRTPGAINAVTFEWTGAQWQTMMPIEAPPSRTFHAMAYDAAHRRIVMFGGTRDSYRTQLLDDTWLYDGVTWVRATPAHQPSARDNHAMVYNPSAQRVMLFGGRTASAASNETWLWDGRDWQLATPTNAPSARFGHVLAYDAGRSTVVLHGGTPDPHEVNAFNDTWTWAAGNWTKRTPTVTPPVRLWASAYFDTDTGELSLLGGNTPERGPRADHWIWNGSQWRQTEDFRDGCGRSRAPCVWMDDMGVALLIGGSYDRGDGIFPPTHETWIGSGTVWNRTSIDFPWLGGTPALAYDGAPANSCWCRGDQTHSLGSGPAPAGCRGDQALRLRDTAPP